MSAEQSDNSRVITGHDEPIVFDNGPLRVNLGGRMGHAVEEVENSDKKKWQRRHSGFGSLIHLAFDNAGTLVRVDNRQMKKVASIEITLENHTEPLVLRYATDGERGEKPDHVVLTGDLRWTEQAMGGWQKPASGNFTIETIRMLDSRGRPVGDAFDLTEKRRTFIVDGKPE